MENSEASAADPAEKDLIEANCRAYDMLDKREARNDKKDELAGKVIDRIKSVKKMIKKRVRNQVGKQLELADRA